MSDPVKSNSRRPEPRRNGSILVALLFAISFAAMGTVPVLMSQIGNLQLSCEERTVDAVAGYLFSLVLFWWLVSPEGADKKSFNWKIFVPNRNFGIGNPTVTMVVTLVTAIVAIFAFSHDLFGK